MVGSGRGGKAEGSTETGTRSRIVPDRAQTGGRFRPLPAFGREPMAGPLGRLPYRFARAPRLRRDNKTGPTARTAGPPKAAGAGFQRGARALAGRGAGRTDDAALGARAVLWRGRTARVATGRGVFPKAAAVGVSFPVGRFSRQRPASELGRRSGAARRAVFPPARRAGVFFGPCSGAGGAGDPGGGIAISCAMRY